MMVINNATINVCNMMFMITVETRTRKNRRGN